MTDTTENTNYISLETIEKFAREIHQRPQPVENEVPVDVDDPALRELYPEGWQDEKRDHDKSNFLKNLSLLKPIRNLLAGFLLQAAAIKFDFGKKYDAYKRPEPVNLPNLFSSSRDEGALKETTELEPQEPRLGDEGIDIEDNDTPIGDVPKMDVSTERFYAAKFKKVTGIDIEQVDMRSIKLQKDGDRTVLRYRTYGQAEDTPSYGMKFQSELLAHRVMNGLKDYRQSIPEQHAGQQISMEEFEARKNDSGTRFSSLEDGGEITVRDPIAMRASWAQMLRENAAKGYEEETFEHTAGLTHKQYEKALSVLARIEDDTGADVRKLAYARTAGQQIILADKRYGEGLPLNVEFGVSADHVATVINNEIRGSFPRAKPVVRDEVIEREDLSLTA